MDNQSQQKSKSLGCVYIVKPKDMDKIKIGCTMDFKKRLSGLKTGFGEVESVFESNPHATYKKTEKRMHSIFNHLNAHGEWFNLDFNEAKLMLQTLMADISLFEHDDKADKDDISWHFLTINEIKMCFEGMKKSKRYPLRNYTFFLLCYKHGLRVEELRMLDWSHVDFEKNTIKINRLRHGRCNIHSLDTNEVFCLRSLKDSCKSIDKLKRKSIDADAIFKSERNTRLSKKSIQTICNDLSSICSFDFKLHIQMIRDSAGFHLASSGAHFGEVHDFLGNNNSEHTKKFFIGSYAKENVIKIGKLLNCYDDFNESANFKLN